MARIIDRNSLMSADRQRTSMDPKARSDLRDSILSKGLLHPCVVRVTSNGGFALVAGGRRLSIVDDLAKEGLTFKCDGDVVFPGSVPCIYLTDLTEIGYHEAELEENLIREDLPWQDRVRAIDAIHRMRQESNPAQTPIETGRELAEKGGIVGIGENAQTIQHPREIRRQIVQSQVLAANLHNPVVRNARNANEAFALVIQQREKEHMAELIRRKLVATPSDQIEVRNADAKTELLQLAADTFDLILGDPPYGIGAGSGGFRSRTMHHHNYEDDPQAAKDLCKLILMEGFRICKSRANLFLFCSIDLWFWLREFSKQCGWTPFNTPVIWQKSESEGLAPWGQQGFRRTCDFIFYATKGSRGLIHSPVDVLTFKRVSRSEREYAAEKPEDLLRFLIEASTLPGEYVLDPCCGSGSTLGACRQAPTRRALGIEIDKAAFDLSLVRAHGDRTEAESGHDSSLSRPVPTEPAPSLGDL
jgi:DNA modification methylase